MFFIALLFLSAGCVGLAKPTTFTILHTNDMHAAFVPHEATWVKTSPKPMVGGFKELEFKVDSIRKVKPNVLLFDAGDVMTGNPITDYEYKGAQGGALMEMMNLVGYDLWSPGNHDLDISQENLIALTKIAKFQTLSANLVNVHNEFPVNNRDYVVLNKFGLRIGVFGIISQGLYALVNPTNLTGLKVLSPVETAQKMIDMLDPQTDLIIAITHQGVDEDSTLAASTSGLDIIVGGHSHTRLTRPKVVNDVIIVQAGRFCENVGELEITVADDKVTKYDGKLVQLWATERPPTQLSTFVDSLQREIEKEYSEVIAHLDTDWIRGGRNSNIGLFITDAQRDAAHADVAFMNASGVRTSVWAGPLTKQKLFEVLPFRNTLTTFQLSGKALKEVLLFTLREDETVLFSGVNAKVQKTADGSYRILEMTVGGKPLDEEREYICTMNDYMTGQSKKHLGREIEKPIYLKETVFRAVERAARNAKKIAGKPEKRIHITD